MPCKMSWITGPFVSVLLLELRWFTVFHNSVILFLSCTEIVCSTSNFAISSIKQAHRDGSVVRTDYKTRSCSSFNPLWTVITTIFRETSGMSHIWKPIISTDFFPKKRCNYSQGFPDFPPSPLPPPSRCWLLIYHLKSRTPSRMIVK